MTWMLYIREDDYPEAAPLRSEAISILTRIPSKDEIVYIGRPFLVKQIICDYDLRVITVKVEEVSEEWFIKARGQSARNATL